MTTKPKRKRWLCPQCGKGKLGLQRPRKNDIIRFCFPCSESSGYLVERIAPKDEAKKAKKKVAAKKKATKKAAAKNKSAAKKKNWLANEKYCFTVSLDQGGAMENYKLNMMKIALWLCDNSCWSSPKHMTFLQDQTFTFLGKASKTSKEMVWFPNSGFKNRDVTRKGKGIRLQRGTGIDATGRAGRDYGCTVTLSSCWVSNIVTIVHELAHVDRGKCPVINGKRRPHDLVYNEIMCAVFEDMWGCPAKQMLAGFSVGNGYEPTRKVENWLFENINNPKVIGWIKKNGEKQ